MAMPKPERAGKPGLGYGRGLASELRFDRSPRFPQSGYLATNFSTRQLPKSAT
jgi:hypothetical protein